MPASGALEGEGPEGVPAVLFGVSHGRGSFRWRWMVSQAAWISPGASGRRATRWAGLPRSSGSPTLKQCGGLTCKR